MTNPRQLADHLPHVSVDLNPVVDAWQGKFAGGNTHFRSRNNCVLRPSPPAVAQLAARSGRSGNTARTLEDLGVEAVASKATLAAAGINLDGLDLRRAEIRGRATEITCLGFENSSEISPLIESLDVA